VTHRRYQPTAAIGASQSIAVGLGGKGDDGDRTIVAVPRRTGGD